MGIGLITVQKEYQGEQWINTHAFSTGAPTALDDSDIAEIGWETASADWNAHTGGTGFTAGTEGLVGCILAFERNMHYTGILINKIYVSDGKQEDIADPNTFAVATVSLPGLRTMGGTAEEMILPGSIALQINRQPAGYSARQGRLFMRGVLQDSQVRFASRGGVDFTTSAIRDGNNVFVNLTINQSGLSRYFSGGALPVQYCIPHYQKKEDDPAGKGGKLIGVTQVAKLVMVGPVSRQMKRGRKRVTA